MSIALGLNESNATSNWPHLNDNDLHRILNRDFGLSLTDNPTIWHSERPFSSAGIVQLKDKTKIFVKRHDQRLRSLDALIDEHRFINHLAEQGLPVCVPLRNTHKNSISINRDGLFEIFPLLKGDDLYHDTCSWSPYHTTRHARSAGKMLARLHQASQTFHYSKRTPCLLTSSMEPLFHDDLAKGLHNWVSSHPYLAPLLPAQWLDDLLPLVIPFHKQFLNLRDYVTPLWGHGDWHGSNLTWQNNSVCSIFDFGMSNLSCAEFDLAVALERSFIRWLSPESKHPISFEQIEHFTNEYNHHCPRKPARYALVASLLPLCHITFALSEIAYYGHLLKDQSSVEIAYHGYLLGHARWFHSRVGQSLLYALAPYA